MNLSLALATAVLLAAEPSSLPPGHPPVPPGTTASPTTSPSAAPSGASGLPEGHPTVGGPQGGAAAPSGELPPGHPPMSGTGRAPPSADELLRQLDSTEGLKEREKTFEIASSLGRLYYVNGRNTDAVTYLLQAEARAKPARELFLAQRKKLGKAAVPSAEAAGCGFKPGMPVEDMTAAAQERAKKGDAAGAAACARAALTPVLDVQMMRGHALLLSGDSAGALAVYDGVLEVEPKHEEALFSRASLLFETKGEDLAALKQARAGFDALLAAYPDSARAPLAKRLSALVDETVKAGGRQKLLASRAEDRRIRLSQAASPAQADAPRPLSKEAIEAVQNTERTPELEQGLAKLVEEGEEHLARGRYQEALANYTRVVPFQPENGRAKAGMAWALVGLGRPMAARVWGVAVQADPAAVERLGDTLKAKGDGKGAKALWQKLASDAPDYANKAALQAKLEQ
jgi:tetratricopeptide (TPR) repeat protein